MTAPETPEALQKVFARFAGFGGGGGAGSGAKEMDSSKFAKLCKECRLLDKKTLTPTDVDLIFTRSKPKGKRKISFEEFKVALGMIAAKKEVEEERLRELVLASGGPASSGTRADKDGILKRMTDSSQYTGAHKARFDASGKGRGKAGREDVGRDAKVDDLSQLVDRDNGDVKTRKVKTSSGKEAISSLEEAFARFAGFGGGGGAGSGAKEMDSSKFAKLCKECRLLDKKTLTPTDVDLIFTRSKPKGKRKISFEEFKVALGMIAAKKEVEEERLRELVLASGGPASSGTRADKDGILKRMTDSSQYTGAHKARFDASGKGRGKAGREDVGRDAKVDDLSQQLDRSHADVRGVKQ